MFSVLLVRIFGHMVVLSVQKFVHYVQMLGHSTRQVILTVAVVLPFVGSSVYALSILRGKTRPQRTTRVLFLLISGTVTVTLSNNTAFWLALASFVQAAAILCLAVKWGVGGSKKFDLVCACICITGIVVRQSSGNSTAAIIGCIVADFAAVLPALIKTYAWPASENWIFYALDSIASAIFVVLGPYTFLNSVYPLYLCVVNALFVGVILFRRMLAASGKFKVEI